MKSMNKALSRSAGMLSRLADWLDRYFWDGLVRLFAGLAQAFGVLSKGLTTTASTPVLTKPPLEHVVLAD